MIPTSKVNLYIHDLYLLILQNYLFQMNSIINIYLLFYSFYNFNDIFNLI